MNNNIKIKFLTDCEKHIPTLAKLWYEEISRHWVADASVEKATSKLTEHLNKNEMPIALVALDNDLPVGMACLRITDGIQPGVTPWLGSLVVDPKYRGQKIGETLINSIKTLAQSLHFNKLHLLAFDPTIPNWYTQLGWHNTGQDFLFGHPVTVMSIPI